MTKYEKILKDNRYKRREEYKKEIEQFNSIEDFKYIRKDSKNKED